MQTLQAAHAQWASRPADQRYLSIDDLQRAVDKRTALSAAIDVPFRELRVQALDSGELQLTHPGAEPLGFTNYSFDKLAALTEVPAGYLRKLADSNDLDLVVANLNTRLDHAPSWLVKKDVQLYYAEGAPDGGLQVGATGHLRTLTSTHFGRILDADVVRAVCRVNADNRWHVPLKAYGGVNSNEATTLYASDRDVFMFLVDENRPIELDGQVFYRGFYTWNSEVGDKTFGISTFLYERVCANRIIWGARDVKSVEFKHTAGAPERFVEEVAPMLATLSDASDQPVLEQLRAVKNHRVGETAEAAEKWLRERGFAKDEAKTAVEVAGSGADGTTGNPTSLLSLIEAGTAGCRTIEHTDARLRAETKWSALADLVRA